MDIGWGRRLGWAAVLLLPLATGCDAAEADLDAPVYAAEVDGEVVVRSGDEQATVDAADEVAWLTDDTALVSTHRTHQVLDLATGELGARLHTWNETTAGPTGVSVLSDRALTTYGTDLRRLDRLPLPGIDVEDLYRGYYGEVAVTTEATFVQWSDYNPDGEDVPKGERGLLRIVDGETSEVLGTRVVDLLPTPDGLALLAVRQVTGEDCGGCIVPQEIVELDPATGEVVEEYGMPEGYVDDWRVVAVDKVGDRVAVQFYDEIGTWVHDGSWELVEGSEGLTTWWQGPDDRIEVDADGRLTWISADDETRLPGRAISVAGRLLPPD